MKLNRQIPIILVLVLALAIPMAAMAKRGGGMGMGGGKGNFVPLWEQADVAQKLGLTDQQINELRQEKADYDTERARLQAETQMLRSQMRDLLNKSPLDEAAYKQATSKLAALASERTTMNANHRLEMRSILTDEQAAMLDQLRAERRSLNRSGKRGGRNGGGTNSGQGYQGSQGGW